MAVYFVFYWCPGKWIAFAKSIARKRLRPSGDKLDTVEFPCVVVAGLGFAFVSEESNLELEKLRDFEMDIVEHKKGDVPITYGVL